MTNVAKSSWRVAVCSIFWVIPLHGRGTILQAIWERRSHFIVYWGDEAQFYHTDSQHCRTRSMPFNLLFEGAPLYQVIWEDVVDFFYFEP